MLVEAAQHAVERGVHQRLAVVLLALERRGLDQAHRLLGLGYLAQGQGGEGLAELLELLRLDRDYQDGLPKKLLLEAFNTIDDEDLVRAYRRKMATLLN